MDKREKAFTQRIEQWIEAGRNPGIAHWHGALEAAMDSFKPHLQPGHLKPMGSIVESEYTLFEELYAGLDLCPDITAAFIPTAMGGVLTPPAAVDSLRRVHKDNKAAMLLCRRPGDQPRILCAEISPEAWKPGVDLFEEGALLGSYEYDSGADCIRDLAKLVRTHLWRKEKWTLEHYSEYTLNWFTRVVDTGRPEAPAQPDFSYIHSPVLLNLGVVEAMFKLIYALAARQLQETGESSGASDIMGYDADDEESRQRFLEGRVLGMLELLRDSRAVDFAAFSPRENEQFKEGFVGTVQQLDELLAR